MSKGNLFLGFARGKVGDVVFSRQGGEQVARARNRSPKNPQTPLQLLQRVVMKSVSAAYSMFIGIADHSFQGLQEGTPNQSRFAVRNVALLRTQLADVINSGDAAEIVSSTEANFNAKDVMMPVVNPWLISEGHLPSVGLALRQVSNRPKYYIPLGGVSGTIPTYAEVVAGLGLQRGDQLTICSIVNNDSDAAEPDPSVVSGFLVQRIILEPASADMSSPFLTSATASPVASPNARNDGSVLMTYADGGLQFDIMDGLQTEAGELRNIVGMAVIVSRLSGSVWQRSTEQFLLVPSGTGAAAGGTQYDYKTALLGDAVLSYMSDASSSLYLNQADAGF